MFHHAEGVAEDGALHGGTPLAEDLEIIQEGVAVDADPCLCADRHLERVEGNSSVPSMPPAQPPESCARVLLVADAIHGVVDVRKPPLATFNYGCGVCTSAQLGSVFNNPCADNDGVV